MRKLCLIIAMTLALFAKDDTIVVGAFPAPHAEILKVVKPMLEKKGYKLKVKIYKDYETPNKALQQGVIDANYHQHELDKQDFNETKNANLFTLCQVHLEPMALYSTKHESIDTFKNGATLVVPQDPVHVDRALRILEHHNIIKIKDGVKLAKIADIVENKHNFKIREVDVDLLPRTLSSFDGTFMNINHAVESGLHPVYHGVLVESKNSDYAHVVVVKKGDIDSPKMLALKEALESRKVREYIEKEYKGFITHSADIEVHKRSSLDT